MELIIDYRDPWNDFNEPFEIGDERNEYERNLEKECLKAVDKVITVSEFQKALILKNEPNSAPVYVVPNGFDFEDYQSNIRQKEPSDKIRLIHFGTLHYRKDYYWIPFLNALKRIKIKHPALCSKLAVEFVGYCPDQVTNYIAELDLDVKLHGILDPFKAYSELNQADIALWFKYDGSPGDFATKFGDYIALKKFIWTFSKPGEVTDYIAANKIGKVFYRNDENLEQTIYEALLGVESVENRTFNPDYNPSSLSIESLTEELLEVLCK
ncbi:hypothetical protein N8987_02380 [Crocinitomix sp.]|nr:hypothetical protein [Crocinitomix sp.]